MQDLSSHICADKLKTACHFIATPWISLDVVDLTVCLNESFWKSAQMSQQPIKDKTRQRARESSFQHSQCSLGGQTRAQGQVTGREASIFHLRKTFLTVRAAQQLNGLLGEVESLEVFKVERSPL